MTVADAEIVRKHFSQLDEELRQITFRTPMHLKGKDLDGYLYWTLTSHVKELKYRQKYAVEREEYELALAIKKMFETRLKKYVRTDEA